MRAYLLPILSSWLLPASTIHAMHIKPIPKGKQTITTSGRDVIDVSGLGTGLSFYDNDLLDIQLMAGGPKWNLQRVKGSADTDEPFYGVSDDGKADCRLLVHVEDDGSEYLAGYLQDKDENMWYEIIGDAYGQSTVIATALEDIPDEAPPVIRKPASIAGVALPSLPDLYHDLVEATSSFLLSRGFEWEWGGDADSYVIFDPITDAILVQAGLMVIWTSEAECLKSGLDAQCDVTSTTKGVMKSALDLAVENMNDALKNSDTGMTVSIKYAAREREDYKESDMKQALDDVSGVFDLNLPDVHGMRQQYDADIVSMVIGSNESCGIGYLGYRNPGLGDMFSVLSHSCTSGYSLAHVIGHNFGCRNDRGADGQCLDFLNFNYGYRHPSGKFRTVMATDCTRRQCDLYSGERSCGRIPYYSSANEFKGDSLGGFLNQCTEQIKDVKFRVGLMCGGILDFQCGCFSPNANALVKGKGNTAMKEIKVGDQVLTASGSYQTVYTIDHFHHSQPTEFLQIHTNVSNQEISPQPLELTPQHMLFVKGKKHPVPAMSIQVGDFVQTPDGAAEVVSVASVVRNGLYSPLTTDGTIIVDGLTASTYTAFLGTEYIEIGGWKLMSHQSFLDLVLTPYRAVCMGISLDLCQNSYQEDLVGNLIGYDQLGLQILSFWKSQGLIVQFLSFGVFVMLFGIAKMMLDYFPVLLLVISMLCLGPLGSGRMRQWVSGEYGRKSVVANS